MKLHFERQHHWRTGLMVHVSAKIDGRHIKIAKLVPIYIKPFRWCIHEVFPFFLGVREVPETQDNILNTKWQVYDNEELIFKNLKEAKQFITDELFLNHL